MAAIALGATRSFTVRSAADLWWWLAYSILGASVITNTIWLKLLNRENAAVAAAQLFMTPLFGLLFGWLLLSEHASASQLAGAVLVAFGIVLVNQQKDGDVIPAVANRRQRGAAPAAGGVASREIWP